MVIATFDGKKMVLRRVARPPPRPPGIHSTYRQTLGTGDSGAIPGGLLGAPDSILGDDRDSLSPYRKSGKHNIPPMRVPGDLRSPFEQLSTNKIEYPLIHRPERAPQKRSLKQSLVFN